MNKGTTTLRAYCRCGSNWKIEDTDREAALGLDELLWNMHRGEGHGSTTPDVARRARLKAEKTPNGGSTA
jgi:hypothetical protein